MADNGNSGIRAHKRMAVSGEYPMKQNGDNFGVDCLSDVNGHHKHPDHGPDGINNPTLHDHNRNIGRHVNGGNGGMGAQSHPDHGPHHMPPKHEGVRSLSAVQGTRSMGR